MICCRRTLAQDIRCSANASNTGKGMRYGIQVLRQGMCGSVGGRMGMTEVLLHGSAGLGGAGYGLCMFTHVECQTKSYWSVTHRLTSGSSNMKKHRAVVKTTIFIECRAPIPPVHGPIHGKQCGRRNETCHDKLLRRITARPDLKRVRRGNYGETANPPILQQTNKQTRQHQND